MCKTVIAFSWNLTTFVAFLFVAEVFIQTTILPRLVADREMSFGWKTVWLKFPTALLKSCIEEFFWKNLKEWFSLSIVRHTRSKALRQFQVLQQISHYIFSLLWSSPSQDLKPPQDLRSLSRKPYDAKWKLTFGINK